MGQNKEELRRLLAFIDRLIKQPGNDEFVAGLRALVNDGNVNIEADIKEIRKVLGIQGKQSIDYSFVTDELTRNQLVIDNLRMEDVLLDTTVSEEHKWYLYCTYAHYQVENLMNYFYFTAFQPFDAALWYIEQNTLQMKKAPFKRSVIHKSVETITSYYKTSAFANEFFPYVPGLYDYTGKILWCIRDVRNEYAHRSGITVKDSFKSLNEIRSIPNISFASIRSTIEKLASKVKEQTETCRWTYAHKASGISEVNNDIVITYDHKRAYLDRTLYAQYKSEFEMQKEFYIFVKNERIVGLYFI